MAYKGGKVQKVMVQPINLIFRYLKSPYSLIFSRSCCNTMAAFAFLRYLQNRSRVSVWLYENVNTRIEGHIIGFDEYMNLVMDGAEEVR